MTDNRRQILSWAEQGLIQGDVEEALAATHSRPAKKDWFSFISQFLMWTGAVAIAVGMIFFFAFNWDAMGRFAKFALLEAIMLAAAFIYSRLDCHRTSSTVSLLGMALLTGALLALTGQTYQTGADPWQLFAVWAALITPWALIGRSSTLWILWIALVNLSMILYLNTFRGLFGFLFREEEWLWIFLAVNTAFLVFFEVLVCFGSQQNVSDKNANTSALSVALDNRQAAQVSALIGGITVTWIAILAIFDNHDTAWGGPVYVTWMAAVFYLYRYKVLDLVLLSGCVLSGILVVTFSLGWMFEDVLDDGAFLLISMAIIGLSAAGGIWLKKLSRQQTAYVEKDQKSEEA
ncbi:DUF2157 domain-containing protein [Neptunomonas japonica]|uniref:DUF2157 domain-containing protein n=1 Tax=Neptunomonas japonica TaxID=417574 RepID=UPI000411388D|nr:DUF2157 domain-containing protein [Neptunomonas japonica]